MHRIFSTHARIVSMGLRTAHSGPTRGGNTTGHVPPPSAPASGRGPSAVTATSDDEWIKRYAEQYVTEGRQSTVAAAYFEDILHDQPEFADCLREARRLLDGQEPTQFTPYQRGLFADRLGHYMSGVAAKKLMAVQQEEQEGKNFTQDGTPTGERYWMEAGTSLSSPAVPSYVKDEILGDMQRDRRADSPAFLEPPEVAALAAKDDGYAAHVRRQKSRLFDGADFQPPSPH